MDSADKSENSESEKLTTTLQSQPSSSSSSEADTATTVTASANEDPSSTPDREDEPVNVNVVELTSMINTNSISPSRMTANAKSSGESEKPCGPDPPKKNKVTLLLKPVGDAPIFKQKLFTVEPDKNVAWIIQYIRRYLRMEPEHSLFFFINQAFAPSPDQLLGNLYECFGAGGKLTLHYSTTVAWG